MSNEESKYEQSHNHGPKFILDIEGRLIEWNSDTITTEKIIELGGWAVSQGVIMIDLKNNTEITLQPGQVVDLRPGLGFSKKVRFKRG
jgi:hypothetical protein